MEGVQLESQRWRLNSNRPFHTIKVVHFFGREGSWAERNQPRGGGLPIWSCQVPPAMASVEQRRDFDAAKVAGWEEDIFGIHLPARAMDWEAMKRIGMSERVVREMREGMQGQFAYNVEPFIFGGEEQGHYRKTRDNQAALVAVEQKVMRKTPVGGDAAEGPLNYRPWVCVPYHAVPKKDSFRLARDQAATGVNDSLEDQECRMPTIDDFFTLLVSDGIIIKRDGKNAFMHFPIGGVLANVFGFVSLSDGGMWRARAMDFGTKIAPAVCMRWAWEMVRVLSIARVPLIIFMDDWCGAAKNAEDAERCKREMSLRADQIKYVFDEQKEETGDEVVVLGVLTDCKGVGRASLPQDKVTKYVQQIDEWVHKRQGTMRELAQLVGRMNFAAMWVRTAASKLPPLFESLYGICRLEETETEGHKMQDEGDETEMTEWRMQAFSHNYERQATQTRTTTRGGEVGGFPRSTLRGHIKEIFVNEHTHQWMPDKLVQLSDEAHRSLQQLRRDIIERNGISLHLDDETHKGRWRQQRHFGPHLKIDMDQKTVGGVRVITTDAAREPRFSCGGWIAGDVSGQVTFTDSDRMEWIHMLELKTAIRAIKLLAPTLVTEKERRILVRCDNSVVVACLSRGYSGVRELNRMMEDLFEWLEEQNIELKAIYIPTDLNNIADALSRYASEPSSRTLALSTSCSFWMQQLQWRRSAAVRAYPGGEWEEVAAVVTRRQSALNKSWQEISEQGWNVLVPLFDEIEQCLEGCVRRQKGATLVIVVVPRDQKARQQSWWRRFHALASHREEIPAEMSMVKMARAKWWSSDREEWGRWLDGQLQEMEAWSLETTFGEEDTTRETGERERWERWERQERQER